MPVSGLSGPVVGKSKTPAGRFKGIQSTGKRACNEMVGDDLCM
ncbi:MAG: hypothetical protein WBM69_07420 [Desulfobacterales bacterium]